MRRAIVGLVLAGLAGCEPGMGATPCNRDEDCSDGMFCRSGFGCDVECHEDVDCVGLGGGPCDRGRGRCAVADAGPDGGPGTDAGGEECAEPDGDGDGHPSLRCGGDDCDDEDANRFPGNPEQCDSLGHDEDCDLANLGRDLDGDDFVSVDCCGPAPEGGLVCGTDCDDRAATVNPSAIESCNGADDDCNGSIDEGVLLTFYRDVDGDGFGVLEDTSEACTAPSGFVLVAGDCDDSRGDTHPGATDICDGVDNDCVTPADPGCGCTLGDTTLCGRTPVSCTEVTGSCNSSGAFDCPTGLVHGGETEACNGVDDNCNGAIDEGVLLTFYRDADGDGFGNGGVSITACSAPAGYVTNATDCDDGNAVARPGGTPNCNLGSDLNCNGIPDSSEWTPCSSARDPLHPSFTGCNGHQCAGMGTCEVIGPNTPYRHDADGDGACVSPNDSFCAGYPLGAEWRVTSSCRVGPDDCNDGDGANYPGNTEAIDGRDNNCNGQCEEGFVSIIYSLTNPGNRADNMLSSSSDEAGWSLRASFFTYNSPNGYTVGQPMVRCIMPSGRHYITIDAANCPAPNVIEGFYGYVMAAPHAGTPNVLADCYVPSWGGEWAEMAIPGPSTICDAAAIGDGIPWRTWPGGFGYSSPDPCWAP